MARDADLFLFSFFHAPLAANNIYFQLLVDYVYGTTTPGDEWPPPPATTNRHYVTIVPRYAFYNRSFLWSSAIFRSDVISNLKKCLLDPPSRPPCPSPQTFQSIFLYPQGKKSAISLDDRKRLDAANMLAIQPRMALYQEMIDHYSDWHPSLLVKLADLYAFLNAGTLSIALYRKVRLLVFYIVIFD